MSTITEKINDKPQKPRWNLSMTSKSSFAGPWFAGLILWEAAMSYQGDKDNYVPTGRKPSFKPLIKICEDKACKTAIARFTSGEHSNNVEVPKHCTKHGN